MADDQAIGKVERAGTGQAFPAPGRQNSFLRNVAFRTPLKTTRSGRRCGPVTGLTLAAPRRLTQTVGEWRKINPEPKTSARGARGGDKPACGGARGRATLAPEVRS